MRFLAVDFGSTYTKVTAVDGAARRVAGTACAFSTVATDLRQGFQAALERLHERLGGEFRYERLLCCSSAAGGLAMVAVGLVPELTAKAARMAAESAGAKVLRTFSHSLDDAELEEIRRLSPDIVLLCGGTDGGNAGVITENARLLGRLAGDFALIVAGNKSAAREVEAALEHSGKRRVYAPNVMPVFGRLEIEPARERIREIFIERIIEAKGLSRMQEICDAPIIPTPLAVLEACELLGRGRGKSPGFGDFLAVDLGGATTDVYSLTRGAPAMDNVLVKGLPEPYAKRSVEGDLGMRYSARFLLEAAGEDETAALAGVGPEELRAWVERCCVRPEILPANAAEERMDAALARRAVALAVERHAGLLEKSWTPLGELYTLRGKDLSEIAAVIGIGGALTGGPDPAFIMQGAAASPGSLARGRAMPRSPRYYLDARYLFSAMGLLGRIDPELALAIMKQELRPISEKGHGSTE